MRGKKTVGFLLCFLLMFTLCTANVFAADTYHISNRSYSWMPMVYTSAHDTSAHKVTTSNACVDAYVYCPNYPFSFKVVLQRMVGGIVVGESPANYTYTYNGGTTTNTRTGQPVQGKYFRAYFSNLSANNYYRVRICDPSIISANVTINSLYFWSR